MAASRCRWLRRGLFAASLLCPGRLAAQEWFDRLNLDKLQLVSLGAAAGRVIASQVEPAMLYGIVADYGSFAPSWHLVFGASYWESRYRDAVVQTFVDSLNKNFSNPAAGGVTASRISMYDVTISAEARYIPEYSGEIKPFLGVGFAGHVINAEGKLINGTFVERSLDNIASGMFLTGGFSVKLFSHFGVEAGARGDLLSGFRSTQIRAGGTYYFGHVRGSQPAGAGEGKP